MRERIKYLISMRHEVLEVCDSECSEHYTELATRDSEHFRDPFATTTDEPIDQRATKRHLGRTKQESFGNIATRPKPSVDYKRDCVSDLFSNFADLPYE